MNALLLATNALLLVMNALLLVTNAPLLASHARLHDVRPLLVHSLRQERERESERESDSERKRERERCTGAMGGGTMEGGGWGMATLASALWQVPLFDFLCLIDFVSIYCVALPFVLVCIVAVLVLGCK